jgi:hypothetical protein
MTAALPAALHPEAAAVVVVVVAVINTREGVTVFTAMKLAAISSLARKTSSGL